MMNEETRPEPRNFLEKMVDNVIDRAVSDAPEAIRSQKAIIERLDGRPQHSVNHVFNSRIQAVDPHRQRLLLEDEKFQELALAMEERASEMLGKPDREDIMVEAIVDEIMAEEEGDRGQ
jgi:hypothetical protein